MPVLAAILGSASVFLLLAYMVRVQTLRPAESRLRALGPRPAMSMSTAPDGAALLRRDPSTLVGRMLTAGAYSKRWQFELERADVKLRPSEYFLVRMTIAAITVVLVAALGRSAVAVLVGLPLGGVMYMMPSYWLRFKTQRRIGEVEKQLVETITLISNGLRAGFAFSQSIDVAAKRVGPPMSVELGRTLLDINLGMSTEDALHAMNARIGSDDVDMMVTAILVQRSSGGNLAEILEIVAETIRDRERIRGEIKTLTSAARFTGWVLSAWPLALGLVFFAINPGMTALLWETGAGRILLALWATLNITGVIVLRKILDIDI